MRDYEAPIPTEQTARDAWFAPGNDRIWGAGNWLRCWRCVDSFGFPAYHHRDFHRDPWRDVSPNDGSAHCAHLSATGIDQAPCDDAMRNGRTAPGSVVCERCDECAKSECG